MIRIAHLYGNLLNTYGDNGNLLMLQYYAKQTGLEVVTDVISLNDPFDPNQYDLVFFGGGQDFEQEVVSKDIQRIKDELKQYIENNGVMLAICGGYQLLGHYYMNAKNKKILGTSILDFHTLSQEHNRFIGNTKIHNEEFDETYEGFENHAGRTFLSETLNPLGKVLLGKGNNGEDKTEGLHYKNLFCSYFHGPLLVRNPHLAQRIIDIVVQKKSLG